MAKSTSKRAPSESVSAMAKPKEPVKAQVAATSARVEKTLDIAKKKAQSMGLSLNGLTQKESLIRAIQTAEGYQSCFATPKVADCGQNGCLWREDCRNATRNNSAR